MGKQNLLSGFLRKATTVAVLLSFLTAWIAGAQNVSTVNGTILDFDKLPAIGASVFQKGTKNGTITDLDGHFSLKLDAGADQTLIVSHINAMPLTIPVTGSDLGIFILQENQLDASVVVSYGEQSRRLITGSVQSVGGAELADMPVAQVSQKLQGKIAGVQINQYSGIPGEGMEIRIRGTASISAGSNPLIVVDGFPINGDLSSVNPDEIESISVLKDASASSLYGSRAANGVILITTHRAKSGASSLSVNASFGLQQIPGYLKPDMMNATEFAKFRREIYEENGQEVPADLLDMGQFGEGTNWFDAITRVAKMQNYSVNYATTTDKLSTAASLGYMSQEGVVLNSIFDRISLRMNSDYRFTDKWKIGLNLSGTFSNYSRPNSDGTWYDSPAIIQSALLTSPLAPYINEDGSIPINADESTPGKYFGTAGPNWYNQVQVVKNSGTRINTLANAYLQYEPVRNLILKTSLNGELYFAQSDWFTPSTAGSIFSPGNENDTNRISGGHSDVLQTNWMWESTASYNFDIRDDHHIDLLAGWTVQKAQSNSASLNGSDYPDNSIPTLNAAKTITGSSNREAWTLASFVSRINYNYKFKYLLSLAYRTDGSSKFGADNRWGHFPSVSAGWVISEEPFMKDITWMPLLKVRASYGVVGNNNVGNYTQYSSLVSTNAVINDQLFSGKSIAGFSNSMLGWERSSEWDLGLDLSLFDQRINFSYDYFNKITDSLLYTVDLPNSSGFINFNANIGKLQFWGHEFTLNTRNFVGEFKWTTDFNIAFNDNLVLALDTNNAILYGDNTINEVGHRMGDLWGLEWIGVYKDDFDFITSAKYDGAQTGTIKFKDQDGDGHIYNDERDKTRLGRTSPVAQLGMTNTFNYKGFDFSFVLQGAFGHKMYNYMERFVTNLDGNFNVLREVDDRWRSEESPGSGKHGKVIAGTTDKERDWFSSNFLYDASYLTVKNITFGWTHPFRKPTSGLRSIRIYGTVQQAFVFTQYPGWNPEASASGGLSAGIDYTRYPVPRTWTLGLNLNF